MPRKVAWLEKLCGWSGAPHLMFVEGQLMPVPDAGCRLGITSLSWMSIGCMSITGRASGGSWWKGADSYSSNPCFLNSIFYPSLLEAWKLQSRAGYFHILNYSFQHTEILRWDEKKDMFWTQSWEHLLKYANMTHYKTFF